jgi:hypothetical protein
MEPFLFAFPDFFRPSKVQITRRMKDKTEISLRQMMFDKKGIVQRIKYSDFLCVLATELAFSSIFLD